MFKDVPAKVVVPFIVITWALSLISALAIVYVAPTIFPVKSEQIGEGSVTSEKIVDSAVITVKLANGSVTSAKILNGTIIAEDLADSSVISVKVANGTVVTEKIADKAVTTDKIADEAVITVKLANGSVTSAKILNGTILAEDLHENSIYSYHIVDGQITNSKLAHGAIPEAWCESFGGFWTNSSDYVPMINDNLGIFSLDIWVDTPSILIIMFRANCYVNKPNDDWQGSLMVTAYVDGAEVSPGGQILAEDRAYNSGFGLWRPNFLVSVGKHTITMYCKLWAASDPNVTQAVIETRSLWVMALP